MNKKFSTLVGGLALLSSLTVGAADFANVNFAGARAIEKLPASDNGLYQLGNGSFTGTYADSVVYMSKDGALQFVPTPANADSLANTLWCVNVAAPEKLGQNPTFDFINKGTGQRLDITMTGLEGLGTMEWPALKDSVIVGGEVYGWAFSKSYEGSLEKGKPLYSYYKTDSVVGLGYNPSNGYFYAVKADATEAAIKDAVDGLFFTKLTIQTAPEIILNANQINTIFGQQKADAGVNLKFKPEVAKNNPFNDKSNKFFAKQVDNGSGDSTSYVYVLKADSSYLRVDTSYANTIGHGYLAYGWTGLKETTNKISATDSLNNSALKAQHQFLFTYRPSVDSVNIYVHRATFKTSETAKTWSAPTDTVGFENARVFAQDLGTEKVLTIDSLDQNVHISLGYAGCAEVESDRTSVPSGLYIIKNAKGEVLAAPIHKNGTSIEWVKLDAQEPRHMPAYQWVIVQNQEALPKTSTIKVINREFKAQNVASLQLTRDKNDNIVTADASLGLNGGALIFDKIGSQEGDSAFIKDAYLGYKRVKAADLDVTKFKFNYLHAFNHNKWIGLNSSADSVLYVQDDYAPFTMKEGRDSVYGVDVTADLLKKIPGLAQLRRVHYVIYNGSKSLKETAAGDKYSVSSVVPVDTFYFKENNHYDGKHYYAFVENNGYCQIADDANKVGVADDGLTTPLKVQNLTAESRTSAFTVEEIDAPLYRRFNNAELEGNEGDASDTLRFVEQYRGEVLQIEGNKNFKVPGVDFLGIYTEGAAPSGLSFIVDTAWVNRGLGYIKPQYLISIERDDVKGTPFQRCAECQRLIDAGKEPIKDCKHDIQATPDMRFGKYLVNFADSVALGKEIGSTKKGYNWKEYDRAGFVKAIQYGDSLYILKDEFAGVTKKDVNPALLAKIIKANDAVTDSRKGYIVNLTTDKHKLITWSMRYVKPGTDNKTFLIESMKKASDKDIAPEYAAWLKMQNGCLVLSDKATSKFNEMTGGDDALIFDVKHVANDEIATDNEVITNSGISIIAGEGNVTVTGAAGKKVVITNILGQTVATAVATSDNETIVVPQGAVIVAVDGEAAVKAMVK